MNVLQTMVFGLVTGSFLIVATLGFALVSRAEKFLNIAHAEFISVAAFVTYFLEVRLQWPLALASTVAVVAAAGMAVVVSRLFYRPIRASGPVVLLITSVGVVFILHGTIEAIMKPGIYSFELPRLSPVILGGVRIQVVDLAVVGLAIVSVLVLAAFLTRTRAGLSIRAKSEDEALAASRGIDVGRSSAYVWLLSGTLAGIAGVLLGLRGALTTDIAFDQILLILSVSILAGLGSVYGVVTAALILGMAMELSTLVIPTGYRTAVAFAAIILVLLVRPEGLSGSRWAKREA